MNRSPFFVAQSPDNLSLDNMFTNSPFSFVVSRLNPRVNDKREPILKAIANLADKLSDVLICVLTPDYLAEEQHRLIKNSLIVPFYNSGHGLYYDERDKLDSELKKFITY